MRLLLRNLLLTLFFFSGTSALVFETLWQRMMTLEFGASAPATTAILTSFFVGIGLGAYLGGKLQGRFAFALDFYWMLELSVAVFGLAVPLLLLVAQLIYGAAAPLVGAETVFGFSIRFLLAILAALPATLCMGATIPTMNRLLAEQKHDIGASVALAFGINTLGAVLGCLATGLILVPWLAIDELPDHNRRFASIRSHQ